VNRQDIIDHLLDHYDQPRNHGPLPDADVRMPGGNPDCGDVVTVYLKIDQVGERIERMTFEGQGCTISQAAASILTEMAAGKSLDEVAFMDANAMLDVLGREVVQTRPRCATLALNTLKLAVAQYRRNDE
jgi:nitrogen fixation NifU-like protein